mgnify:CR=1 FL=1
MKRFKKLLYVLPILLSLVFIAPPIQANATDWTTYTVHITRTGSKYHKAGCSYLKSDIPINILDAVNSGYTPCSRCNPPYPTTTSYNAVESNDLPSYVYVTGTDYVLPVYYDSFGFPIQDTVYRGYYSAWAQDWSYRKQNNLFNDDLYPTAFELGSPKCMSDNDLFLYSIISDRDRAEMQTYGTILNYDSMVNTLVKYAPIFDISYYTAVYPDKVASSGNSFYALMDFLDNGISVGLQASPTFNVYTYMNNNPDLIAAYGSNLAAYYNHYITSGQFEGRIAY